MFCALLCFVSPRPQTDVGLRQYNSSIRQFFWNILTISKSYRGKKRQKPNGQIPQESPVNIIHMCRLENAPTSQPLLSTRPG